MGAGHLCGPRPLKRRTLMTMLTTKTTTLPDGTQPRMPMPPHICPTVARVLARIAAGLPGADRSRADRIRTIDRVADTNVWSQDVRAALLLREAVDWPAVEAHFGRTRRMTAKAVRRLHPERVMKLLVEDLACKAE